MRREIDVATQLGFTAEDVVALRAINVSSINRKNTLTTSGNRTTRQGSSKKLQLLDFKQTLTQEPISEIENFLAQMNKLDLQNKADYIQNAKTARGRQAGYKKRPTYLDLTESVNIN